MPAPDEQTLIDSCKAGKLEDFSLLYDRYADPIYRYIRYRVRDTALAEDLASQTFLRAMEKIKAYDGRKGTFSGWLYRIARNGVIDHYRSHKQVDPIDETFDVAGDDDATRGLSQSMAKKQVDEMLRSLDADKREILLLRIWDGLSYQEIAQVTGKTETNCKVIVSRTLASLRETFPTAALLLLISFPFLR
jgi:RNA polymerase sigma-70 factor, ECF subfamily